MTDAIKEAWLTIWQFLGGWDFFGPLIVILLVLGMMLAADSRRDRKKRK